MTTATTFQPEERLLPIKDVEQKIGFKKSYIYKEIIAGNFPPPIKRGKSSRWKLSVINAWIEHGYSASETCVEA